MARITLFLLLLILRNNAYAWSCSFANTEEGWYLQGSMRCQGISTDIALEQHYCGWYRPNDPYCSVYQVPVCSPQVEYQTLSCPVHQSGAINQSRSYDCTAQTWTGWTTTSNNCTPDPPTCIESTETRTLTCQAGFEGLSQEQRISICSDPYGSPTWTTWSEIYNTCKMTATNVNNPTSPISPISPMNPTSVLNQQIAPAISVETVTVQDLTATVPTISKDVQGTTMTSATGAVSTSLTTTSSASSSAEKKDSSKETSLPKGKEIVPGFGIVMSMQLINASYSMQQQQIEEYIKLEQENEYGRIQEFTLSLLSETNVGDRFDSLNRNRWANLLRNNPLQRLAEYD